MGTVHVPDDLLAQLRAQAATEGKSVDELATEALRRSLEDRSWQDLLAYGRERRHAKGFTEDQAADVVHEWRKEQPEFSHSS
jgi:hypothetical protein